MGRLHGVQAPWFGSPCVVVPKGQGTHEAATWLAAAIDFAWNPQPDAVRARVGDEQRTGDGVACHRAGPPKLAGRAVCKAARATHTRAGGHNAAKGRACGRRRGRWGGRERMLRGVGRGVGMGVSMCL